MALGPSFRHVERITKRTFSSERRRELADKGYALPDGSFPIENVSDLRNAITSVGREGSGKRAQVIAHIKKRARALGHPEMIPEGW